MTRRTAPLPTKRYQAPSVAGAEVGKSRASPNQHGQIPPAILSEKGSCRLIWFDIFTDTYIAQVKITYGNNAHPLCKSGTIHPGISFFFFFPFTFFSRGWNGLSIDEDAAQ